MSDDDFGFDFFDEPETTEAQPVDREPRRPSGGSRPPEGPHRGPAPILRLVGLIVVALVIVVVLVLWVSSCSGGGKKDSFSKYMTAMATPAQGSAAVGKKVESLLTAPGTKTDELVTRLGGLAQEQQQYVQQTEAIKAPHDLADEQTNAVEVMELRLSGIRGLADTFRQTAGMSDAQQAGQLLSAQMQRLTASDVMWQDFFKGPSVAEMQRQGVSGVPVPPSQFIQNPDLASSGAMTAVFRRVHGATAGTGTGTGSTGTGSTGLHGTGIVSTVATPSGTVLQPGVETTVKAGVDLGFVVTVQDTGDFQEVNIPVTLTIQQSPNPIVAKQTITVIAPGETKTLTFSNLGTVQFATKTTVRVDVNPVPGEKNTANNSAEYPVIFSLG